MQEHEDAQMAASLTQGIAAELQHPEGSLST